MNTGRDKLTHVEDTSTARNGTHASRDLDVDRGGEAVGHAKFDLGLTGAQLPKDQIPWGYGSVRINAMARDPDWLYVYWEVTDEAIATARQRLGKGGLDAWCCLRVYDTTGRAFDGTNAHEYFDIAVDRTAREWFIHIGKPTSVHHVDIGMKSREGYFQVMARSGRAESPRKSPSRDMTVEWMTVEAESPEGAHPTARPYRSRFAGPEPVIQGPQPRAMQPDFRAQQPAPSTMQTTTVVRMPYAVSWRAGWTERQVSAWTVSTGQSLETQYTRLAIPWLSTAWRTEWQGDQRAFEWLTPLHSLTWLGSVGSFSWVGPAESYSWVAGPYPVHISPQERVEVRYAGGAQLFVSESGRHMVAHGPWQVTILPFDPEFTGERKVLGTWLIHWVRPTTPVIERWETSQLHGLLTTATWQHFMAGGSENLLLVERGASEWWTLGASELMWLGASELVLLGGSEVAWLGASASLLQWMGAGASEWVWGAGSEVRLGGASEQGWLGASEQLAMGASEWSAAGASEVFGMGASEWLGAGASAFVLAGASEQLVGGASEFLGASEWMGASEAMGASERLGASEAIGAVAFPGASEMLGASEALGGSELLGGSESLGGSERLGASEAVPVQGSTESAPDAEADSAAGGKEGR